MIMKKLSLIIITAIGALAFQACKSGSNNNATTADSTVIAGDTSAKMTATAGPVDKGDSAFVITAANDGITEVAIGNVAQHKALSARVKNFADMMVTDHTKAGDELGAIAKAKNITVASTPNAHSQKMIDDLSKKSGKAFDKAYVNGMVDGHEKAVKLFTDASNNCKDADLKAFAAKTLPTLKMHLDSIKAIKSGM